MKPLLQKLPLPADSSFVLVDFDVPFFETPWHFHPEYEIVLVTESTGQRFVGEHIKEYRAGDLCLIGPNVPHLYRSHEEYYVNNSELRAKSIVIHFKDDFLGKDFFVQNAKPNDAVCEPKGTSGTMAFATKSGLFSITLGSSCCPKYE